MANGTGTNSSKYGKQRQAKNPPHFALKHLRGVAGITAAELCRRIQEHDPELECTRGTISAIESGSRGASPRMLAAICAAFGLPGDAAAVDYQPVARRRYDAEDAA